MGDTFDTSRLKKVIKRTVRGVICCALSKLTTRAPVTCGGAHGPGRPSICAFKRAAARNHTETGHQTSKLSLPQAWAPYTPATHHTWTPLCVYKLAQLRPVHPQRRAQRSDILQKGGPSSARICSWNRACTNEMVNFCSQRRPHCRACRARVFLQPNRIEPHLASLSTRPVQRAPGGHARHGARVHHS